MNNIMPVRDVAAMLNISMCATTNLIRAGRLRAVKVGPTWIIERADAEALAEIYVKRLTFATTRKRRAAGTDTTATEAQDGAL